ncbi:cyclase-associated 1 [Chlorella sorokiniana]|uniref:Cyclase-associated 1 n=1 Tax=Chlorella sorokiniana TaxID=3076 RepID=A0A2P6TFE4_CHLSO|nr:cyclase-associated 1 [Chlorella sorokiniana]|eukprot:PRW32688.1 cyclase-associated 1 [Chlorella sorokiniana]
MSSDAAEDDLLPEFDEENPQGYYLVDSQAEMVALSDAVLVAADVRLPVHSQVLSLQSSVLRGMFADFLGASSSGDGEPRVGCKRKAADEEGPLVLEEPFRGCSLYEAVPFLRLCYRPQDVTQAHLAGERASLPALLRLAHKLDAGRILEQVVMHMTESSMDNAAELVTWTEVAEQCQQTDLRLSCVARLVKLLVTKAPGQHMASGITDAAQLEGLDKSTLLLVLGLVTGAGRQLAPKEQLLAYTAPPTADISTAMEQAANPGSYEWRIEQFSQQPSQPGDALRSPWFTAAGREWQLTLYPNGQTIAYQGHISLYLAPKVANDLAVVTFTVCDQSKEQPTDETATFTYKYINTSGRGYADLMSLEKLRARPGCLAGDTLLIRAELLPSERRSSPAAMLEAAVARLEQVTARLEATEARLASIAPGGVAPARAPPPPTAAPAAATAAAAPAPAAASSPGGALADYRQLLSTQLVKVVDAAEAIGGQVLQASRVLAEGFRREEAVVEAIGSCQKPDDAALQQLVHPVGEQIMAAGDLAAGPRSPYQHHFKLVSEAMQSLSWVVYSGPNCGIRLPAQHVEDAASASEFYANKVLVEWRAKDPNHAPWVASIKELLQSLKAFCARHFPAGPTWNANGIPVSQFKPGASAAAGGAAAPAAAAPAAPPAAAAKKPGGPPPPPPPPPPGSLLQERKPAAGAAGAAPAAAAPAGGGNAMAALFADINKGSSVTTGLRKVTDDMKTKNRPDRGGAVPAASAAAGAAGAAASGAKGKAAAAAGPPRVECEQGRKWVVENQVGNREIAIDQTDPKQTVYIYNCSGSTIQVRGKVNAITLDKCSRTGLLFEAVVATCEVVNCTSVDVQCTGTVPTVAVDKVDGCQLYLPRTAMEGGTDVTTAKSSAVNVIVPGATEDADPIESPIPEQYVTRCHGGRWVTEPVAHSGA